MASRRWKKEEDDVKHGTRFVRAMAGVSWVFVLNARGGGFVCSLVPTLLLCFPARAETLTTGAPKWMLYIVSGLVVLL